MENLQKLERILEKIHFYKSESIIWSFIQQQMQEFFQLMWLEDHNLEF